MEETCSMFGCNNKNNLTDVQFYRFPSDLHLCSKWVESCRDPQLFEDLNNRGVESLSPKTVCSWHFSLYDFIDPELKQLKPAAIPKFSQCRLIKTESDDYTQVTYAWIKKEGFDEQDCSTNTNGIKNEVMDDDNTETVRKTYESEINIAEHLIQLRNLKGNQTSERIADSDVINIKLEEKFFLERKDALDKDNGKGKKRRKRKHNRCSLVMERRLRKQKREGKKSLETSEEREVRKLKDRMNSANSRKRETELQYRLRKYKMAQRAALRRRYKSEEENASRRKREALRISYKRSLETEEQNAARKLKRKACMTERRKQESRLQTSLKS